MPRRNRKTTLEQKLTPAQLREVCDWLTKEGVSYAEMRRRLRERFNISLSLASCSNFFHKLCQDSEQPSEPVLLDVVITPAPGEGSVRLQILQQAQGVNLKP